jgi:nucleoside-diphosphate-sugar epimerase
VKCLVTGATGFIGRQLCQFLNDQHYLVTALSRSGATLPEGAETTPVDLAEAGPAAELLQGVDAVFHLAGIAHRRAPEAEYEKLNHQAVIRLARQAAEAGVKCFIFLSSVKAMGPAGGDRERTEEEVSTPEDAYGRAKWAAECDLRREFVDSPMSVIILRPTLVYGPGASGNLLALARAASGGLPRPPAGGARSMVSSRDLIELMCSLAENPPTGLQTWIVSDGQRYMTRDVYDLLRGAQGKGKGVAWLPAWGWRIGAGLIDLGRSGGTVSTYERLFGTELYSSAALTLATGWQPGQRLDETAAGELLDAGVPC